jgi:hypothetical protein
LVDNPILHARTKHVEIQYHFIREKSQSGEVTVSYVPTTHQQADILTKPLEKTHYETLRSDIGVKQLPPNTLSAT